MRHLSGDRVRITSMSPANSIAAPPKRRWYQYSLRTLFVVMTLVAVLVTWLRVIPVQRQQAAVRTVQRLGGHWWYDEPSQDESWIIRKLRDYLPRDYIDDVIGIGFEGCKATDADLESIQGAVHLKSLWIGNNPITDAGLEYLAGLTEMESLNLDRTQVTDAGLTHLRGLRRLQGLYLFGTKVTHAAVVVLQKSLPDCEIDDPRP